MDHEANNDHISDTIHVIKDQQIVTNQGKKIVGIFVNVTTQIYWHHHKSMKEAHIILSIQ